ncbi:MAG TPA: cytochrome c biogenesis protein CcsA [Acidimicrobiia bacterium]
MTRTKVLGALALIVLAAGTWLAWTAPPEAVQREYYRIINIHVPSAWLAFLAFGVTAAGSIGWRITRKRGWDRMAASSAEIGVMFIALALVTGMIWGRPVWGRFWDWQDARMATTALMFFVYLGYLGLRRATPDPIARADRASILGIVAVVQVPLVYFSVYMWRTLHQTPTIRPDGAQMHPQMLTAMLVNLAGFTLLYLALLSARMLLAKREDDLETAPQPVAGTSVARPSLES